MYSDIHNMIKAVVNFCKRIGKGLYNNLKTPPTHVVVNDTSFYRKGQFYYSESPENKTHDFILLLDDAFVAYKQLHLSMFGSLQSAHIHSVDSGNFIYQNIAPLSRRPAWSTIAKKDLVEDAVKSLAQKHGILVKRAISTGEVMFLAMSNIMPKTHCVWIHTGEIYSTYVAMQDGSMTDAGRIPTEKRSVQTILEAVQHKLTNPTVILSGMSSPDDASGYDRHSASTIFDVPDKFLFVELLAQYTTGDSLKRIYTHSMLDSIPVNDKAGILAPMGSGILAGLLASTTVSAVLLASFGFSLLPTSDFKNFDAQHIQSQIRQAAALNRALKSVPSMDTSLFSLFNSIRNMCLNQDFIPGAISISTITSELQDWDMFKITVTVQTIDTAYLTQFVSILNQMRNLSDVQVVKHNANIATIQFIFTRSEVDNV